MTFGLHLPTLVGALHDPPTGLGYLDLPNSFWVVKFYDLGIVVPAAVIVGIGLLRGRPWARKPAYAILGGYVLLGWSVAGMAWTMLLNADPDASVAITAGFTGISLAGTVFAYFLYQPLLRDAGIARPDVPGRTDAPPCRSYCGDRRRGSEHVRGDSLWPSSTPATQSRRRATPSGHRACPSGHVAGIALAAAPWASTVRLRSALLLVGTVPFAAVAWWSLAPVVLSVVALVLGIGSMKPRRRPAHVV